MIGQRWKLRGAASCSSAIAPSKSESSCSLENGPRRSSNQPDPDLAAYFNRPGMTGIDPDLKPVRSGEVTFGLDRELNASLDTSRAVMTTLEWAMRQSGATAGLLGIMDEERPQLRVMASQGYGEEMKPYESNYLPLETLAIPETAETGAPI